jgi:hypothetical protein
LGIRAGFFYPFAEPAKHFLTVNAFAAVKAVKALQQLGFQCKARDIRDGKDGRACSPGLLESNAREHEWKFLVFSAFSAALREKGHFLINLTGGRGDA